MSTNRSKGLGRGFGSLIPQNFDNSLLVDESERVNKLLITDVIPNPEQPRKAFDAQTLEQLAGSIKRYGVLQPLIVRPHKDSGYVIVAGERRWRASKQAGLTHVPAIIRSLKELEQLELALVENVQRVDLSPMEQALSIARLHEQFSIEYAEIAKRLGKASTTINNIVRLLNLPEPAKVALGNGTISEGHARAILALKDLPEKQDELLKFILKNGWSVRQAEQFAIACKSGAVAQAAQKQSTQTETPATKKLGQTLKAPVAIKRLAKGGNLMIRFKSDKDLERIMSKLSK